MRNWMLLLLAASACQPAESAVREDAVKVSEVTVSDAERQRMEDSTKAWIAKVDKHQEAKDSAGLMDTYLPGPRIVAAANGQLFTVRDSSAAGISRFYQAVRAVTQDVGEPYIDVVAPGVAALTYPYTYTATSKKGKTWTVHGVYSAVLAERDGRLRIIQEHYSEPPEPAK